MAAAATAAAAAATAFLPNFSLTSPVLASVASLSSNSMESVSVSVSGTGTAATSSGFAFAAPGANNVYSVPATTLDSLELLGAHSSAAASEHGGEQSCLTSVLGNTPHLAPASSVSAVSSSSTAAATLAASSASSAFDLHSLLGIGSNGSGVNGSSSSGSALGLHLVRGVNLVSATGTVVPTLARTHNAMAAAAVSRASFDEGYSAASASPSGTAVVGVEQQQQHPIGNFHTANHIADATATFSLSAQQQQHQQHNHSQPIQPIQPIQPHVFLQQQQLYQYRLQQQMQLQQQLQQQQQQQQQQLVSRAASRSFSIATLPHSSAQSDSASASTTSASMLTANATPGSLIGSAYGAADEVVSAARNRRLTLDTAALFGRAGSGLNGTENNIGNAPPCDDWMSLLVSPVAGTKTQPTPTVPASAATADVSACNSKRASVSFVVGAHSALSAVPTATTATTATAAETRLQQRLQHQRPGSASPSEAAAEAIPLRILTDANRVQLSHSHQHQQLPPHMSLAPLTVNTTAAASTVSTTLLDSALGLSSVEPSLCSRQASISSQYSTQALPPPSIAPAVTLNPSMLQYTSLLALDEQYRRMSMPVSVPNAINAALAASALTSSASGVAGNPAAPVLTRPRHQSFHVDNQQPLMNILNLSANLGTSTSIAGISPAAATITAHPLPVVPEQTLNSLFSGFNSIGSSSSGMLNALASFPRSNQNSSCELSASADATPIRASFFSPAAQAVIPGDAAFSLGLPNLDHTASSLLMSTQPSLSCPGQVAFGGMSALHKTPAVSTLSVMNTHQLTPQASPPQQNQLPSRQHITPSRTASGNKRKYDSIDESATPQRPSNVDPSASLVSPAPSVQSNAANDDPTPSRKASGSSCSGGSGGSGASKTRAKKRKTGQDIKLPGDLKPPKRCRNAYSFYVMHKREQVHQEMRAEVFRERHGLTEVALADLPPIPGTGGPRGKHPASDPYRVDPKQVIRALGVRWKTMSAEERQPFVEMARDDKERLKDELRVIMDIVTEHSGADVAISTVSALATLAGLNDSLLEDNDGSVDGEDEAVAAPRLSAASTISAIIDEADPLNVPMSFEPPNYMDISFAF
ncbi:hypothetical protein GQ42DRAFT_81698 [Ramicandelaber brevisporus]|nr:hypothetical protein GQ42DRAFT_81698 [Ramicandelaber brevisporus]